MSLFDDFPRGVPGQSSPDLLGTASWKVTASTWTPGAIWLGHDRDRNEVGHQDDRHIVTVAGSRAGKGRSVIIPNLLRWPGSCVVNDPKGENASLTALHRAGLSGHEVAVVDPHRAANVPDDLRVSFNPLDLIDGDAPDAIDVASAIGDAIMIDSGDGKDVHWTESARAVIEAIILHVATSETGEARSLVRVRQLLTMGDPEYADMLNAEDADTEFGPFDALWRSMSSSLAHSKAVRDVIAGSAHSVQEMGDNERGSVLSTARRSTKFIDSPWMRECLQGGDGKRLDIDALKAAPGGLSVYVCLPARFFPTHARFLRLMLNLILFRMEAQGLDKPRCGYPVLFVIDEFAALGRLDVIEKAAGLMAGFGVKLWPILQDLGQIKKHYRDAWETFLGNAGILQFFANSDMTTLDWLSKRLGQIEVQRATTGTSEAKSSQISKSQSRTENSGWSRSQGQTAGSSEMPGLSQVAARDGGSGLVPFLARSGASGTGQSVSSSAQQGETGGQSVQQGDSSSSGTTATETRNVGIHHTALMNPDEIARLFDRSTGRQIVFLDNAPVVLRRVNWDAESDLRL
ncbi:type IV secretory system conjugative DNA transfer family protein [Sphingobium amiense]|uniref:type IV secretory system conjugative DNA transfer family protein n=1 Tax=Sphingobium amiense TaxID=135719 RepID=UPI0008302A02|nr:type IV secretory system conjugative DNA transfer family protein [Sphingobium amiense]